MAQRPTVTDLIAWMDITSGATEDDGSPIDEVLQSAREYIESRCVNRLPVDYADVDATDYPRVVRLAILLGASKLYKRKTSPEGVAGFGDLGVVRILGSDPDVEALIGNFLNLDGFA